MLYKEIHVETQLWPNLDRWLSCNSNLFFVMGLIQIILHIRHCQDKHHIPLSKIFRHDQSLNIYQEGNFQMIEVLKTPECAFTSDYTNKLYILNDSSNRFWIWIGLCHVKHLYLQEWQDVINQTKIGVKSNAPAASFRSWVFFSSNLSLASPQTF